ncbi:MAG: YfiR family protein [Rhodocyclales bacterium]|nr:YfiR family protein [Rhodocyclales bacterium]
MIYNLMLFVDWPAESLKDTVTLCVITDDPDVSRPFAELAGKTVRSKTLMTQRRAPLAKIDDCDAVFLSGLDESLLADKLASVAGLPVLTLASSPGSGAMIDLALAGERIVFDVSATRLRSAGLSLASRVMQLARKVHH